MSTKVIFIAHFYIRFDADFINYIEIPASNRKYKLKDN